MRTTTIQLRNATPADIQPIDDLLVRSYSKLLKTCYPPSTCVMAIPLIAKANPALISSGSFYVAVDQDDAIIAAGGWSRSIKGAAVADVRHVVTDHRHTRKGIARRLMMGIISEARNAGVSRLDCLSTRFAVPFYGSLGFDRDADLTIGLRPGIDFPVVRMQKAI